MSRLIHFLTYGMRRSDIDSDNGWIYVRQQINRINSVIKARDLKTVNSRRSLLLMATVSSVLLEYAKMNGTTPSKFNSYLKLST